MANLINFKLILSSSFYPAMPLFTGALSSRSVTKWRGAASEFTYNSYLRNGWVVVDTGVKGSSGTPIIEFSTWQASKSRSNIIIPNTISYKFFMADRDWRTGYLTRSAVEANENWGLSGSASPAILNRYTSWRTSKESQSTFILLPVFNVLNVYQTLIAPQVTTQFFSRSDDLFRLREHYSSPNLISLVGSVRLALKFSKNLQNYKRDFIKFSSFDKQSSVAFYDSYKSNSFSFFYQYFISSFFKTLNKTTRLVINNNNNVFRLHSDVFKSVGSSSTFLDTLSRLNVLVIAYVYTKNDVVFRSVFEKFAALLIKQLSFVIFLSTPTSNNAPLKVFTTISSFLVSRVKFILLSSQLSLDNLARLIVFFLTRYVKTSLNIAPNILNIQTAGTSNLVGAHFFKHSRLASYFFKHTVDTNKFLRSTLNLQSAEDFFTNYLKIRTKRSPFNFKYKFFRRRRKYAFAAKPKRKFAETNKKVKWYYRSWSKLTSFFKLFFLRKQFFFISFWTFNFFNLSFVSSTGKNRRVFLRTVRLIYFFKKFFNFFKFYSFYFNLLQMLMSSNKSRKAIFFYKHYLNNLSIFLWILHLKFWRVLRSFASLARKFFLLRWKKITTNFSKLLKAPSSYPLYFKPYSLTQLKKGKRLGFVTTRDLIAKASSSLLAKSYVAFLKHFQSRTNFNKKLFSRKYLQFLLILRKKSIKHVARALNPQTFNVSGPQSLNLISYLHRNVKRILFNTNKKFYYYFLKMLHNVSTGINNRTWHNSSVFFDTLTALLHILDSLRSRKVFQVKRASLNQSIKAFIKKTLIAALLMTKSDSNSQESRTLLKLLWASVIGFTLLVKKYSIMRKLAQVDSFKCSDFPTKPNYFKLYALTSPLPIHTRGLLTWNKARLSLINEFASSKRSLLISKHGLRVAYSQKTTAYKAYYQNKFASFAPPSFEFTQLNNIVLNTFTPPLSFDLTYERTTFLYEGLVNSKDKNIFFNKLKFFQNLKKTPNLLSFYRAVLWTPQISSAFFGATLSIFATIFSIFSKNKATFIGNVPYIFATISSNTILASYNLSWYLSEKLFATHYLVKSWIALLFGLKSFYSRVGLCQRTLSSKELKTQLTPRYKAPFISSNFSAFFLKKRMLLGPLFDKLRVADNTTVQTKTFCSSVFLNKLPISAIPLIFKNENDGLFYRSNRATLYFRNYRNWLVSSLTTFPKYIKPTLPTRLNPLTRRLDDRGEYIFFRRRDAKLKRISHLKPMPRGRQFRKAYNQSFAHTAMTYVLFRLWSYRRYVGVQDLVHLLLDQRRKAFLVTRTYRNFLKRWSVDAINWVCGSPKNFKGKPTVFKLYKANLAQWKTSSISNSTWAALPERLNTIRANAVFNSKFTFTKFFSATQRVLPAARIFRAGLVGHEQTKQTTAVSSSQLSVQSFKNHVLRFLRCFSFTAFSLKGSHSSRFFNAQSAIFTLVRSAPKLLLESNARRLGLLPKYNNRHFFGKNKRWIGKRYVKRKSFWLPKHLRFKHVKANQSSKQKNLYKNKKTFFVKNPSQIPSVFSRNNRNSMQLSWDFKDAKFRFLRIRKFFAITRKTKFFFKGAASRITRIYKLWKKRRKRQFLRRFRKSKLLRLIKKKRKFYLKKLIRRRLRFSASRSFFKAFLKLTFLRRYKPFMVMKSPLNIIKTSSVVKENGSFKLYYHKLYSLILQKIIFRLYTFYWKKKETIRLNLFRELRFSFIFKFIGAFFKKSFLFFSGFVVFTKLAFFSSKNFLYFTNKFSFLLSNASVQGNFNLLLEDRLSLSREFKQNVLAGLLTNTANTARKGFMRSSFFALTGFIRASSYKIPNHILQTLNADFWLTPSLQVWTRVTRSFSTAKNFRHTLVLSRLKGYAKPRRLVNKNVLKRIAVLHSLKLKRRRVLASILNAPRRTLLRKKMDLLPRALWSGFKRLRTARVRNRLKLSIPLYSYLRSSLAKRKGNYSNWRIRSYASMLKRSYPNINYSPLNSPLKALSKKALRYISVRTQKKAYWNYRRGYEGRTKFAFNVVRPFSERMADFSKQLLKKSDTLPRNYLLRDRGVHFGLVASLIKLTWIDKTYSSHLQSFIKPNRFKRRSLKKISKLPFFNKELDNSVSFSKHILNRFKLNSQLNVHARKYSRFKSLTAIKRKALSTKLNVTSRLTNRVFRGLDQERLFRWRF